VCGLVVLGLRTVFCVLLSVWIGCTEVRYCALCGVVCVDWLHWGKVLCVRWFCVCGEVVLKLGTVCWVVLCEWMRFIILRYCVLGGVVCVVWLYWGKDYVLCGVVCVDWFY